MTNKLKGGKADNMTLEDIARKHNVFLGTIKKQFEMGVKIEMEEHTKSREKGEEIAMDHLVEDPEYYTHLIDMEKKNKIEPKEQTSADSSGSYEGALSMPILKRDIFKLSEMEGIAAMPYDGPIGTAGPSSPMDHKKKKRKDPLALDEKGKTASITAASTKDMVSTKKGFPKFGGPNAKFVEIDARCKKFPYCNQGFDSDGSWKKFDNIKLTEIAGMTEAINEASKKFGISPKEILKMIVKEGIEDFGNPENMKAMLGYKKAADKARGFKDEDKKEDAKYNLKTLQPIDITTSNREKIHALRDLLWHFDINLRFNES